MRLAKAVGISALALLGAFVTMPESNAQQPPSDANIAAIVLAANQIDIDYAKLALS